MIKNVKRLGIFAMYDVDGIVDDYVIYLLDAIKPFISNIIVVCDGAMKQESIARLKNCASEVIINDRGGYDSGSYKAAIDKYGWDVIREYDELILFNDSNYGPIYPLSEMFEKMDNRECDFWALTYQSEFNDEFTENITPAHYRSDFYVFRKTVFSNKEFVNYWNNLQSPINYQEAVKTYEFALSELLHTLNFKGTSYVEMQENVCRPPISIFNDYVFIISSKLPLIKRKIFTLKLHQKLNDSDTRPAVKILEHVKTNTLYDENLILKHLIRICDVSDIRNFLGLCFVFPQNYCFKADILNGKKIGIILHINYTDLFEHCFEYINRIPDSIDVIVTTKGESNKTKIKLLFEKSGRKNYRIVEPQNRGREVSARLIACRELISQYDYLCCTQDKKSNKHSDSYMFGQTYMDLLWDNSVVSAEYIKNVINCFEENPLLGLLAVPPPYHGKYFVVGNRRWSSDFNNTKNLSERLKLKCKISEEKQPLSVGGTFWCRTAALKTLFNYPWKYDDFLEEPMPINGTISHAIERIYPYVAQHEGYMSGTMMSDKYAGSLISSHQTMLETIIFRLFDNIESKFSTYAQLLTLLLNSISSLSFAKYIIQNKNIYLYGAGAYGMYFLKMLLSQGIKPMGFVVSDGHKKESFIKEYKVYELCELPKNEEYGLLITVDRKNTATIIENLNKYGFTNYYSFYENTNLKGSEI